MKESQNIGQDYICIYDDFINGDWNKNWENGLGTGTPIQTSWKELGNIRNDYIMLTLKKNGVIHTADAYTALIHKGTKNRLGYGYYGAKFAIDRVPTNNEPSIFIGMTLWEFGKSWKDKNFNEINMGFFTSRDHDKNVETQLKLFTAKNGKHSTVNMICRDEKGIVTPCSSNMFRFVNKMHVLEFMYSPGKVDYYFDGYRIMTKTDNIPDINMAFYISVRNSGDQNNLQENFNMYVDWARIYAELY